jgi:hypothetical protein
VFFTARSKLRLQKNWNCDRHAPSGLANAETLSERSERLKGALPCRSAEVEPKTVAVSVFAPLFEKRCSLRAARAAPFAEL